LPEHLQREIYKEERRKKSIRFLSMKKPLYDNIEMYHPDNRTMLCTIGKKKANWYVKKQLAVWRREEDAGTMAATPIKTNDDDGNTFERMNTYNINHKKNICVACGGGLMRHYVVPYSYRKKFPIKFKTHLPHDIVLLCIECHIAMDQAIKICRTDIYEQSYRTDPNTRHKVIVDEKLKHIKSYSRALYLYKNKLPKHRIQLYEKYVLKEHLVTSNQNDPDYETDADAYDKNLITEKLNPKYIPLVDLVIKHKLKTDQDVREFVIGWRQFFVDTLNPQYLPIGWSVNSPVESD
ncbi:hypothetical protein FRACYDRAFT_149334, partial [Fragilariopsis cylindrus CCMP1102]